MHKHNIYYKNLCHTGKNMPNKKNHFRHCLLYEYDKAITASATCLNISKVHAKDAMDDSTCCRWLKKFRQSERSCKNHSRSESLWIISDEHLYTDIKISSHTIIEKLTETFSEHRTTSERQMHAIGFIKSSIMVPHQLTVKQCEDRIIMCVSLISCDNSEPFLNQIVTVDER